MVLGWEASFIEFLACFEFLEFVDGLVEHVLELSFELFLLGKDRFDIGKSAISHCAHC